MSAQQEGRVARRARARQNAAHRGAARNNRAAASVRVVSRPAHHLQLPHGSLTTAYAAHALSRRLFARHVLLSIGRATLRLLVLQPLIAASCWHRGALPRPYINQCASSNAAPLALPPASGLLALRLVIVRGGKWWRDNNVAA